MSSTDAEKQLSMALKTALSDHCGNDHYKVLPHHTMSSSDAEKQFLMAMKTAFSDGRYSDFTIHCGNDHYKVHKIVITALSEYFTMAVKFGKEKQDNEIFLQEDSHLMVKLMIHYLYNLDYDAGLVDPVPEPQDISIASPPAQNAPVRGDRIISLDRHRHRSVAADGTPLHTARNPSYQYPKCAHGFTATKDGVYTCPPSSTQHTASHLLAHIGMYMLGDKYLIPTLKTLACQKFKECAHLYCDDEYFVKAIETIWEWPCDAAMKDAVVETLGGKMSLMKKKEVMECNVYDELMRGVMLKKGEQMGWW